jgi:hypothetical protein
VDENTPGHVALRNRKTGKQQTLRLLVAAAEAGADTPAEAATAPGGSSLVRFSKAWISSSANPMMQIMQQLPIEIVMEWPELPKEQ